MSINLKGGNMKRTVISLVVIGFIVTAVSANDYLNIDLNYRWKYDTVEIDSLGSPVPGTNYTLISTIIGDTTIADNDYFVMQDSSNEEGYWEIDEEIFLRVSEDSLILFMNMMDLGSYQDVIMAVIPGPIGMTWEAGTFDTTIVEGDDTIDVSVEISGEILDFGNVVVPAGAFPNTYHLLQSMAIEFTVPETTITAEINRNMWMAENVGPVKFLNLPVYLPGDPEPGQLQELVEYQVTGVEQQDINTVPATFSLEAPYPNPFNPITAISYQLPALSFVNLTVHDVSGRQVAELVNGWMGAGVHEVNFEASGLASGIYIYHIEAGDFIASGKMVLMK